MALQRFFCFPAWAYPQETGSLADVVPLQHACGRPLELVVTS